MLINYFEKLKKKAILGNYIYLLYFNSEINFGKKRIE